MSKKNSKNIKKTTKTGENRKILPFFHSFCVNLPTNRTKSP